MNGKRKRKNSSARRSGRGRILPNPRSGERKNASEPFDTRPTERHGGEEIGQTAVKCWNCGAVGILPRDVGRCDGCGEWCEVIEESEGQ